MKIFENMAPGKVIAMGFFFVILIGTLLLMLPISSQNGEFTSFTDCLFTATSATCITGLTTVVTSEHWNIFGQIVILMLIQIGGMGFMSFVTLVFMIMGKRITMKNRLIIRESYNIDERRGLLKFIKLICKFSFSVEILGAVILSLRFVPKFGLLKGIYYSLFHSISAFCNAGFDLLGSNSLVDYSDDVILCITIMLLIIIGGIGFPVVMDMYVFGRNLFKNKYSIKMSFKLLKLHSKVVIVTTLFLILFGGIFFTISEYGNSLTLGPMSFPHKLLSGMFQSVTLRTAGFASIEQSGMNFASKFMSIILMFIGGSPASTAGGVKTVTAAVVVLCVISLVRGKEETAVFKRTISSHTIRKALSVVIIMIFTAFVAVMLLSVTERGTGFSGEDYFYEVFSAIDTVGVTTGLTPYLTTAGKYVIILCMFIGKIGPVTMAMLFTSNVKKANIRYPDGNIIVG